MSAQTYNFSALIVVQVQVSFSVLPDRRDSRSPVAAVSASGPPRQTTHYYKPTAVPPATLLEQGGHGHNKYNDILLDQTISSSLYESSKVVGESGV
jgi:hypothetical protein